MRLLRMIFPRHRLQKMGTNHQSHTVKEITATTIIKQGSVMFSLVSTHCFLQQPSRSIFDQSTHHPTNHTTRTHDPHGRCGAAPGEAARALPRNWGDERLRAPRTATMTPHTWQHCMRSSDMHTHALRHWRSHSCVTYRPLWDVRRAHTTRRYGASPTT